MGRFDVTFIAIGGSLAVSARNRPNRAACVSERLYPQALVSLCLVDSPAELRSFNRRHE